MKTGINLNKIRRKLGKIKIRTRWLVNEMIDNQRPLPSSLICPICEFSDRISSFKIYESLCIFGGGKLLRHECPACGLIFGTQRMLSLSLDELDREYAEHYSCYNEGDSTDSELRTFQYLNPKPEGVYLNFGCGRWSKTIDIARDNGYQLFGFDPYANNEDHNYIINDVDALKSIKFDGIISNDVLEHFRYPCQSLLFMASLLKEKCPMVHRTHCYTYSYEYTRFHLYFYTGESLKSICNKSNLFYYETDHPDIKIFYKK